MPGTGFHLDDSDVRLIQEILGRLEALEQATSARIMPGMTIPYFAPARSAKYSESHQAAVSSHWTHHLQLNDINRENVAYDRNESNPLHGLLKADSEAAMPLQGQPGGLQSEGSYSYYFPGKEKSRIEVPLLQELTTGFFFECLVKPESLNQLATIFYNGVYGTNGWGIGMSNAAGSASGNLLTFRYGSTVLNTGYEFAANAWSWIGVNLVGTTLSIAIVRIDPLTKTVTPLGGSFTIGTITKPTGGTFVGNASATATVPWKGWIDNVLTYDGTVTVSDEPEQWGDRWRTAIEPASPPGFVVPDGTVVSRAKYDSLFKAIGTIYGAGDGTTTFALPNIGGRFMLQRVTAALGYTAGEETHTLSVYEMPHHAHTFMGGWGSASTFLPQMGANQAPYGLAGGDTTGNPVQGEGGGGAHNNMPPWIAVNHLLKT